MIEDDDSDVMDNDDDDDASFNTTPGFILSKEGLENAKGASQSTTSNNPALQIQKYEEELRAAKRKFQMERRLLEEKHHVELNGLQQQMRTLSLQHETKLKVLKDEIQKMKEASSANSLQVIQKQLEDVQEKSRERAEQNESLREQLSDSEFKLEQERANVSRLEGRLQEMREEMEVFQQEAKDRGKLLDDFLEVEKLQKSDGSQKGSQQKGSRSPSIDAMPHVSRMTSVQKIPQQDNMMMFRTVVILLLFSAVGFFLFKKIFKG